MAVAAERCMEYTALSIGCKARLALFTALGVTARFTARPGCMARRTLRGTNNLEKKPTRNPQKDEMAPPFRGVHRETHFHPMAPLGGLYATQRCHWGETEPGRVEALERLGQ
jgi:hypothetical protein